MVLDSPLDSLAIDGASVSGGPQQLFAGNGLLTPGSKPWQKLRPSIEILCNNQVSQLQGYVLPTHQRTKKLVHWSSLSFAASG